MVRFAGYIAAIFVVVCLLLGCAGRRSLPLVGKWVFAEDEAEIVGRYVYDFGDDGSIYLLEYSDKEDDTYAKKNQIGTFERHGDAIVINWQNGKVLPSKYDIEYIENGIVLIDTKGGCAIHLMKTKQCR